MPQVGIIPRFPTAHAIFHIIFKDNRAGAGGDDNDVREVRSVADIVKHLQREVVGGRRLETGGSKGFDRPGGLWCWRTRNRCCAIPGGVGDGGRGVTNVIAVGRALQAIITGGSPGEIDLRQEHARDSEIVHRGRRDLIIFQRVEQIKAAIGQRWFAHVGQGIDTGKQAAFDLGAGQRRLGRPDQRGGPGHVRCRHGSTAGTTITARITHGTRTGGYRRKGINPRCGQIDPIRSPVREAGVEIFVVSGRDRDNVFQFITGGISDATGISIAGGADVQGGVGTAHRL